MEEVILLKYGELILKGQNRHLFEDRLFKNIRKSLHNCGPFSLEQAQSTVFLTPGHGADLDGALCSLSRVFGIVSISRACVVPKDMAAINEAAACYLKEQLQNVATFKVEARRSDKHFPLTSPEIAAEAGAYILESFGHLSVDVHNPELIVNIEIRDRAAYIHAGSLPGAGGLPAGIGGRAALLISGGIDSPVAGYMLAKRGLSLCAVHFESPPYTSERARIKVLDLLKQVSLYSGRIECRIVPFTRIQEAIRRNCPEPYFTLIMRRLMMRAAGRLAQDMSCQALVTGESLGQVASQTISSLICTEAASVMPVFRPLIGLDKEEIIRVARKIGTFETSILPYKDCCTVFTPRHPETKPRLISVEAAEKAFDFGPLLEEAVLNTEKISIGY